MRQVVLYTAASLDNYIARPDGDVEWLNSAEYSDPKEDYGYQSFLNSVDTTLMGNNTYKMILGFDMPFPYPDKTNYVISRSNENQDTEFVSFIRGGISSFIEQLKKQEGQDIWLIGGGQINTLLLNKGLIDRVILTLIPVILGDGIPMFDGQAGETRFDLETSRSYESGLVQLTFKKKDEKE